MTGMISVLQRRLAQILREGRLDEAQATLDKLKQEDPLAVQTRGGELELLLRKHELDEAALLAQQLVASFPTSARILFLAGQVAYRRRSYKAACEHFQESQALNSHWQTRHWLGKSLTQLGKLDEAEPLLVEVAGAHPHALGDLAWLHERMGNLDDARSCWERFCAAYPENEFGRRQLARLRACGLESEQLQAEMETLIELGEEIPAHLAPEYLASLLSTGQGKKARGVMARIADSLDDRVTTRVAWICYKSQAFDLAYELFSRAFAFNLASAKFFNALETAAVRSGNVEELLDIYRSHAADDPRFYGRIRRLGKRA